MVSRLQKQAERLRTTGEIFIALDPTAQKTGIAKDVERLWMPEDAKLPEYKSPEADEIGIAVHNAQYNRRMEQIPTSVDNTTTVSIRRGQEPGAIEIVSQTRRVDLGYKIPTISFDTGSPESDRQAAAEFLTQNLRARQSRTPEERKADEWNKAMESSLLTDETKIIVLEPSSIKSGKIKIQQRDNITGLSFEHEVPIKGRPKLDDETSGLLNATDFNLVRNLQQKKDTVKPDIAQRIDGVIRNFLGK